MKYIGMHAFMPGSPVENPEWARSWSQRVTTSRLIYFYLRHPGSVLRSLRHDLEQETWQRRPVNLSNFRRSEGREAGAKTKAFGWWSGVRTWLFQLWPWHIVVWYGAALGLSIWHRDWILPTVLFAAGLEFAAASLIDAAETYRHLLLFQIYTDLSFLLGLILYLEYSADKLLRRKIPGCSGLSKVCRKSGGYAARGIMRQARLEYLQIGVGSEASCMVNPPVCWVANARTIWTQLVACRNQIVTTNSATDV